MLVIKDVIFNPPATIVFWGDGSKTIVKCQEGEEFDPEKGLTMAFFKRMHDNKGHYFEEIKKWTKTYNPKRDTDSSNGVDITFTFGDWCEAYRAFNALHNAGITDGFITHNGETKKVSEVHD